MNSLYKNHQKITNYICALIVIFSLIISDIANANQILNTQQINETSCIPSNDRKTLISGWFEWEPYQYEQTSRYGTELTGLDMEVVREILQRVGYEVELPKVSWDSHLADIKSGSKDVATGAVFSKERGEYAYFSDPYRYEDDSLFTMRSSAKKLEFSDIQEFLAQVKGMNYKLGVIGGSLFADELLNQFINDPENSDLIVFNEDDATNLKSLLKGEVDGFITDKLVGSALIIKKDLGDVIEEIPLGIKIPTSLMLSKKTISYELLQKINEAIAQIITDGTYDRILKNYLYPILLMETTSSRWYNYVTIIGVIAFAIAGVAIGASENMTFFGTFLAALIPPLCAGILKDFIVSGANSGMANSTLYVEVVIVTVLVSFSFIRILEIYNKDAKKDDLMKKFWKYTHDISDALGQSCFIVTGVSLVIISKVYPFEIWGPLFAFVIANVGTMLRDLFTKAKEISVLNGQYNAEISIIWGLIYSSFISYNAGSPDVTIISTGAIATIICAFISRLYVIYHNIQTIRFK